jgi:hypothetical protein
VAAYEDRIAVRYTSEQGATFFEREDADPAPSMAMAGESLERSPHLVADCDGPDTDHACGTVPGA